MTETLDQRIQALEKHLAAQPNSPLFAQLAGYYLEKGRSQDALTVCDTGLAHYPFYTTGHLIKGKTLLSLNMRAEARREFEFVHEMLPLNEAVDQLVAQIPMSPEESLSQPAGVTADTPVITPEAVHESAPVEPAIAEADQVLSQFTDEAAELAAQEPAVSAEPPMQEAASVFEALSPEPSTPAETTDPFGISTPAESPVQETFAASEPAPQGSETTAQIEEAFSAYADQKRGELFGLENSVSLDEYLSEGVQSPPEPTPFAEETPPVVAAEELPAQEAAPEDPFAALTDYADSAEPATQIESPSTPTGSFEDPFAQLSQGDAASAEPKDQIEEIAEKLKEARRITPVINLADRSSATPSEADTPSETGFVTPTLAEIYAKQGWYDDAIKAYKTLALSKPADREKYENRIRELEELKKQQAGT
jgi:tetratricopeptide (TPR) repeat protein